MHYCADQSRSRFVLTDNHSYNACGNDKEPERDNGYMVKHLVLKNRPILFSLKGYRGVNLGLVFLIFASVKIAVAVEDLFPFCHVL